MTTREQHIRQGRQRDKRHEGAGEETLWRRLKYGALGGIAGLALLVLVIFLVKHILLARERAKLRKEEEAGPMVQTAKVVASPPMRTLSLIGEARPYAEVTLYAKVSGFLRDMRADKGDKVKAGELLARVESPETDRDYEAAVANAVNLRKISDREQALLQKRFVSQQEADQASANASVAEAQARALLAMKGYEDIRAPFNGTVTARYSDAGALIQNAENGQSGALPVFTVSDTARLRVFAYLDQSDASLARVGAPVVLSTRERPDVKVPGRITRLAGELDPRTRTLLTEIDIDNRRAEFVPGSLLEVKMQVPSPTFLAIPIEALVIKGKQDFTPLVTPDKHLHYQPIEIGDNDGVSVQVLSGLKKDDQVAMNVGESIKEGSPVQIGSVQEGGSAMGGQGPANQGQQKSQIKPAGESPDQSGARQQ